MTPRYLQVTGHAQHRWMVSYLDVLTVVLIFFLVVAARTVGPPAKPKPAPPAVPRPQAAPQPQTSLQRAEQLLKDRGFNPKIESRGLVVSLPQVVLFAPGDDAIDPRAQQSLARIAEVLREIPNEVRLVGHADASPIHNRRFRNNWELAVARSQTILEVLNRRYGISDERLSIASYGSRRPAAPNDTADGRATNRRVEFIIPDQP
jgi:chemotaxis protein MotB